jgi:hypothetical protein
LKNFAQKPKPNSRLDGANLTALCWSPPTEKGTAVKQSRKRTRKNRQAAIDAAAIAFTGGQFETSAELWALTVFFERYLERGAKGTLKQFGPAKAKKAKILKLVPRQ